MPRLFVALRPPAAIRQQLLTVMGGVPNAKWQTDEQLHVTLRFIGDVEPPRIDDIALALDGIGFPRISTRIEGVGQFDMRGRPHALWAGLNPFKAIAKLHRKIDNALIRIGLEPEHRSYLPHITLTWLGAKCGPIAPFLVDHAGLVSEPFLFDHFLLYESQLSRQGSDYTVLGRYALVDPLPQPPPPPRPVGRPPSGKPYGQKKGPPFRKPMSERLGGWPKPPAEAQPAPPPPPPPVAAPSQPEQARRPTLSLRPKASPPEE